MDELIQELKKVLANSFAFYVKAQNYHWNVEGPNFPQYHTFLGNLYEEVQDSIDTTAENIRMLGAYAPSSFNRFSELSDIEDELKIPTADVMMARLLEDNEKLLVNLERCFELSEANHQHGLSDWIAGRQDAHKKHAWMLRSILKNK
jgi:starvation-inducible DNA-binding protein